jgi:hypothetical protein
MRRVVHYLRSWGPFSRFALKVAGLVSVAFATYFALVNACMPAASDDWWGEQTDKLNLLRRVPGQRVILIGGSNLAFGIDSRQIAEALHRPVVNNGLDMRLGLRYTLARSRPLLHARDIVVLVPEYEEFVGDGFADTEALLRLCLNTHTWGDCSFVGAHALLSANRAIYRWPSENRLPTWPYRRSAFNRDGDVIGHLSLSHRSVDQQRLDPHLNRAVIEYAGRFLSDCRSAGMTTVFVYPVIMRSAYVHNEQTIAKIDAGVRSFIPQPVAGVPQDWVYDDRYFFDSVYHLDAAGRQLRTRQLIATLQGVLALSERVDFNESRKTPQKLQ